MKTTLKVTGAKYFMFCQISLKISDDTVFVQDLRAVVLIRRREVKEWRQREKKWSIRNIAAWLSDETGALSRYKIAFRIACTNVLEFAREIVIEESSHNRRRVT